jgi:O-antigen/teichoic acid export membrane protein
MVAIAVPSKSRFVQQATLVILPKLLAGIGTAAIGLVLVRFMSPTSFGVLSLCLSGLLMMDGLLGSAFDLAAVRMATASDEEDGDTPHSVQHSCMLLKVGAAFVAGVLLLLFDRVLLNKFFGGYGNGWLLLLTLLAGTSVLLLRSTQIYFQLERRFRWYGMIDLGHNGLKCVGVYWLISSGRLEPGNVLMVYLVAPSLLFLLWAFGAGRVIVSTTSFSPKTLLRMFGQARWYLLTFGIGTLVARADLWLVARYTNVHMAGVYSAAQMIAIIPPMIGTYLSVVVSPRVMPLFASGKLLAFTTRVQTSLLLTSVLGYDAMLVLIPRLSHLLPARFHDALPVFLVLLPGSLAGFVSFPLTLTTLMFLRPRFLVGLDAATLPIIFVAYAVLVPRFGMIGAAWVCSSVALGRAIAAQLMVLFSIYRSPVTAPARRGPQLTGT